MRRFTSVLHLGLGVLALVAVACSASDPDVSSDSSTPAGSAPGTTAWIGGEIRTTMPGSEIVTADTLVDQTFTSTTVTGHDLVPGSHIRLSFTATDLSIDAGCNTLGASYALEGGRLVVGEDLRSTQMACPEPLGAQDSWLSGWLGAELTIAATTDGISLTGDGVTVELVADAAPDGAP